MPSTNRKSASAKKPAGPTELKYRKPSVFFTEELKQVFLDHYRENGLVYLSAELTGVASTTVNDAVRADPIFAEAFREAKQANTDMLVAEAKRRAYQGVDEPIVGGKDRDEIVTYKRVYSDRLLELLLRANREEFRNKDKVDDGGTQQGGVLVMPSRPLSIDEWEAGNGEAAKGTTGRPENKA